MLDKLCCGFGNRPANKSQVVKRKMLRKKFTEN